MMPRWKLLAPLAVLIVIASGCYWRDAQDAQNANGPTPWWCTSTEEIPVTSGPAVGSVDYYAGTHKAPLSPSQCTTMSAQFDIARAYAQRWPTEGAAEADGWRMATTYIPGMGTHHIRGGITAAMLADPTFDKNNPILDDAGLDDVFDPTTPEVLQFDGNGPTAKLVGFDYYVRTSTGLPPAGFPGNNDWWHIHPKICFRSSDAAMVGFNTSDAACTSLLGVNVNMANYYMLHVWVLDDMTFEPDVFAGMMPCIFGGTAIHDAGNSCHVTRGAMAAGHDMSNMDGMEGM
jgi:hypothetical protein